MKVKGWIEFEVEEKIDPEELEDKIYDLLSEEYHDEISELPSVTFMEADSHGL